jgi:peptide/nickel transport system substrate-binding protein
MQNYPGTPIQSTASPALPHAPLGRYIRWQVFLALVGIFLLTLLLGVTAYNVSTELVPDQGGVFREGVAGNPQYINPLLCQMHEVDQDLCRLLFRGLTRLDGRGQVVPDLAEVWSTTADGLVYTFRLRESLFWHDGVPITAEDVLFTVGMMQSPDTPVIPDLANLWRSVEVEQVDERTVRFILDQPFAPFLDYTAIGLLPQHIWGEVSPAELASSPLNAMPVGNGPMKVTEVAADHIRLESNPYYNTASAYISAVEFRFYPDYPSIYAAYSKGELDGISRIVPSDLALARDRQDLQLFSALESVYVSIIFNLKSASVPFFQEKAVRQALYYALDREKLIANVLDGQGIVADSPIPATNWAHTDDVRQYPYDPDMANRLLNEAGWIDTDGDGVRDKDGRPLSFILLANDDPVRQAILEQISTYWRAVGVQAVPESVSFAGLVSDFLAPRRFDAALVTWDISGDPDPYPLWHSSQAEEGGQNYAGWQNEAADELLIEARSKVDGEKRAAIYDEFQKLFSEEAPALLLYYPAYTYGVSDRVKNVQIGALNDPSDRFTTFHEWYIMARRVPTNQMANEN